MTDRLIFSLFLFFNFVSSERLKLVKYLLILVSLLLIGGITSAQQGLYCAAYLMDYNMAVYSRLDGSVYAFESFEVLGWRFVESQLYLAYEYDENAFVFADTFGNEITINGQYEGMSVNWNGDVLIASVEGKFPHLWLFADGEMTEVAQAIVPNWGPDGSFSATKSDGSLYIFETDDTDGELVAFGARNGVWSPDGTLFAYSTYPSGQLIVINVETGEQVYRAPDNFWSYHIAWIDQEMLMVSGVWDENTDQHLSLYEVGINDEHISSVVNEIGRDLYDVNILDCYSDGSAML